MLWRNLPGLRFSVIVIRRFSNLRRVIYLEVVDMNVEAASLSVVYPIRETLVAFTLDATIEVSIRLSVLIALAVLVRIIEHPGTTPILR
jgi:hypothetical protein